MKIALYNLTTTTKSGGIETFNWEMARVLSRRGHTVHIYGGKSGPPREGPPGVPVFTYPFIRRECFPNFGTRFRRFMERLSFGFSSLRDLIRRRYDFLYLIKPYDIPIALLVSARSGAKVIFGSSGTEFFPGYKSLVRKAHHFFACSEFNASQIEQYCGIRPDVIHNGVDTGMFRPLTADPELRNTLGLRDRDAVILTVGRLVALKGIRHGIMAVDALLRKGYRIKYLIAGEGPERENLRSLVKALHREEDIFFLGNIANPALPAYYACADMALFPSVAEEAFGIAVAEAMACGIPSVAAAVGAIPEVTGDAGLLVPPGDAGALALALEKIVNSAGMRSALGAKGRRRIEDKFNWDTIADKFEGHILRGSA